MVAVDRGAPELDVTPPGDQVPPDLLRAASAKLTRLVAHCPDAYFEVDASGIVTQWNPRAELLLGWRRSEVVGHPATERLLASPLADTAIGQVLARAEAGRGRPEVDELHGIVELLHRNGGPIAVDALLFEYTNGPEVSVGCYLRALDGDGTGHGTRRAAELYDRLTGLPNRVLFGSRLAGAVRDVGSVPGAVAVVLLDLDRFKGVNNSMGHGVGDQLLEAVAGRLRQAAGGAELIARLSGDEFLALFVDPQGSAHAAASAFIARARSAVAGPFEIGTAELFCDVSVGVALNTFGVDDPETLLSNAEAAMYQAKRRGGSGVETFGESMRIEVLDRLTTEHSLRRALERRELEIHYQPVVEIAGVTTVGVEALVRWDHPDQGLVAPYRFIPVAEESGLIIPIGAWVLEEACRQLREWRRAGPARIGGSLEVNLSARQIDDPRIVRTVEGILARTGIPPELLTLEITESALMHDAAAALTVLRALKALGVQLAIDDFGTGYSSLGYLRRFPLDFVKVDRMFVEELGVRDEGAEIVAAVVGLAHALGLEVVAEGVETEVQLEVLRDLGCDYAQGYLFSKPVPAVELASAFGRPLSA